MTTPVTAPTSPAVTPAAKTSTDALTQLSSNFQTFLSLLTTQLKNQDPLTPLDSNQFTQQLVQMSGVQAQLTGNGLLQQVATNTSNGISTAVGLIGKSVKATSDTADLSGGKAAWTYNLASDATDVKLQVVDSNGKVVHAETPASLKAGDHDFTWDGKDLNGAKLADGTYTLKVTALDGAGKTIATSSFVQGRVTSVEQSNGTTLITVNGSKVSWDKVVSVTEAATTSPATGA
ncbi:MAG: flgD [Phenylobacterium sp.]|nr:flgD [Phenylobacterium sp.]MDB5492889.1 flgD [Phenylobacterium sp.]